MAAPTNTFTTASAVGIREDLHDRIFMLNKDEFPFMSAIGSGTAKNTYTEWQTDALGNGSSTNYNYEGDDTAAVAVTATSRVGNRTQILKKSFTISDTEEVVDKAGRKSEVGYQTMKQGRQIKMDLETTLMLNQASIAESAGVNPRKMGGFLSWLTSNVSRGVGGSSGGFSSGNTTAATNGTQRTFTETLMKTVMQTAWNNGARAKLVIANGTQKQNMSGFTGIATQFQQADGKLATVIGAIDRYVSDFGTYNVVADRYASARDVIGIQPDMAKLLWLRKFKRVELARSGDARKFHIIGECTLEVSNEAGHWVVADLT